MQSESGLQMAVKLARAGNRDRAYNLLVDHILYNPKDFLAWLWMSELAGTLEEQTMALEQAQALCPPDAEGRCDLQPHLNLLRGAIPLATPRATATSSPTGAERTVSVSAESAKSAKTVIPGAGSTTGGKRPPGDALFQAERFSMIGKREEAIRILTDLVETHPQDEAAWLLLCELQPDPEEKVPTLQKFLAVHPENSAARKQLEVLLPIQQDPLQRGRFLEEAGEYAQAISLYQMVNTHSKVPTERVEASRRIAEIQLRKESDQAQAVHPTLNLLRVTAGPVLLFLMMVFIQSGLNLFHAPILAIPGIASVLVGSFCVSATSMRPMHPRWIALFGVPGSGSEPLVRQRIRLAGWLCMLAPFSIFLVEAGIRLGALRASMFASFP